MDKEKLIYYKDKLNKEKERANKLIKQLKDNDMTEYNAEMSSELSFYDNHPSDIATEVFNAEMGRTLEATQESTIGRINDALKAIDEGSYGKCKKCGKDIEEERLEILPYAENCIKCENAISEAQTFDSPLGAEEKNVFHKPLESGLGHYNKEETEFDAEDSYQAAGRFNEIRNVEEYDYLDDEKANDGYVEDVEKISNQQYKNQLPD